VQNGTPLFALQELGGWESAEMVRRYAHLVADHLAPYAERLCAAREVENETVARFGTVSKTARACRRQALDCLVAGARFVLQRRCVSGFELHNNGFASTCKQVTPTERIKGSCCNNAFFPPNQCLRASADDHFQSLNGHR